MDTTPAPNDGATRLHALLDGLYFDEGDEIVLTESGNLTLAELRRRSGVLTDALHAAGVRPGHPVGNLVTPGGSGLVAMFAIWLTDAVYIPINARSTATEVRALVDETPVALIVGSATELDRHEVSVGAVEYDHESASAHIRAPVAADTPTYDPDIALVLRTSGTTGRPKAVLLRHSGTIDALDASLTKLRRSAKATAGLPKRYNLIPVSLALWAGVFNTLFSFRAGFGVVLLDRFSPHNFATAVRRYDIRSVVLPPAMITMLTDAADLTDLSPLQHVRSITAPLSPEIARRFHDRFGVFVLNSYGQTELGGEVVGWTGGDLRHFGLAKLGAAGRAYDHVDLRIRSEDGHDLGVDELGEILVRSPYRMRGYALANGNLDTAGEERFVDGYLRTGDIGRVDEDGFLWIQGRISDMINRGGLKIYPDEVEEALRQHPQVLDAGVAGLSDRRLGEVPHAWVITNGEIGDAELEAWCRQRLVPYKVPTGFTRVRTLPRSDIGKLLRRELVAQNQP